MKFRMLKISGRKATEEAPQKWTNEFPKRNCCPSRQKTTRVAFGEKKKIRIPRRLHSSSEQHRAHRTRLVTNVCSRVLHSNATQNRWGASRACRCATISKVMRVFCVCVVSSIHTKKFVVLWQIACERNHSTWAMDHRCQS